MFEATVIDRNIGKAKSHIMFRDHVGILKILWIGLEYITSKTLETEMRRFIPPDFGVVIYALGKANRN